MNAFLPRLFRSSVLGALAFGALGVTGAYVLRAKAPER